MIIRVLLVAFLCLGPLVASAGTATRYSPVRSQIMLVTAKPAGDALTIPMDMGDGNGMGLHKFGMPFRQLVLDGRVTIDVSQKEYDQVSVGQRLVVRYQRIIKETYARLEGVQKLVAIDSTGYSIINWRIKPKKQSAIK